MKALLGSPAVERLRAIVALGIQGDGLINKLNQVIIKLDDDQAGAACNQLSSFNNQVSAFINSGALTQAEGQSLIDAANAIKTSLGCQ